MLAACRPTSRFEAEPVRSVGERVLPSSQALIVPPSVSLRDARRVHSHPIALAR